MLIDFRLRGYGAYRFFQDNPQAAWALLAMAVIGGVMILVLRQMRPAYVNRLEGGRPAFLKSRYYPTYARRSDADSATDAVWKNARANQSRIPGYELSEAEQVAGSVDLLRRAVLTRDYGDIADLAGHLGDDDLANLIRQGAAGKGQGAERKYQALVEAWLLAHYPFAPERTR